MRDQADTSACFEPRSREGYAYFIQADVGGPVKIGWTVDPENRLDALQCGHPYTLKVRSLHLADRGLEGRLHKQFAAHRLRGEWFEPTPEMVEVGNVLLGGHRATAPLTMDEVKEASVSFAFEREGMVYVPRDAQFMHMQMKAPPLEPYAGPLPKHRKGQAWCMPDD